MQRNHFARLAWAVGLSVLLGGSLVLAQGRQTGTWQALMYPDPAPGVWRTWCFDMNGPGDMVGYYVSGGNKAFVRVDGAYYSLHPTGATSSMAWGINSSDDIVGEYTAGGVQHGFLIRDGEFTTLDLARIFMTHPRDINARGDIVGFYMATSPASPAVGFLLEPDGTFTDVWYPGSVSTSAIGLNDHGDVTGEYKDASGLIHGFVRFDDGDYEQIDYPWAISTSVQKIASNGTAVGYFYDAGSKSHGFTWRHGEFEQVDYPGAAQTMLHGVNNQGETCGMMMVPGNTQWAGFGRTW